MRLVNLSFENGAFPNALKRACVVIPFKGGLQNDPASYGPISLFSMFSNFFKKLYFLDALLFSKLKHLFLRLQV